MSTAGQSQGENLVIQLPAGMSVCDFLRGEERVSACALGFRELLVSEKIKIRLEAYDHRILDKAVQDIVDTAKRTGAKVAGPIPLPTRIEKFTVLRSPHIDKKSREQFEIRTHKRMVEILDPTAKTNELFSRVDVPAGVDITIRQTVR